MMTSPFSSIAMVLESCFLDFIRPWGLQMEKSIINSSPSNSYIKDFGDKRVTGSRWHPVLPAYVQRGPEDIK